jgi:hypothetical protein
MEETANPSTENIGKNYQHLGALKLEPGRAASQIIMEAGLSGWCWDLENSDKQLHKVRTQTLRKGCCLLVQCF